MLFLCVFATHVVDVYFTPSQKCLPVILKEIKNAKKSIKLMCYSFTSQSIAKTLIEMAEKGLTIEVIADKSQTHQKKSKIFWLHDKLIPIYIDDKVRIAHNKVIIIDNQTIITGSYNWTHSAEHNNAENLVIIRDAKIARMYLNNWNARKSKSFTLTQKMIQCLRYSR